MANLPTGTVTFLFTDIEGSTRLLQELGRERYQPLQDEHAAVMRSAIAAGSGTVIRTEGDAFFAVFPTPAGAVRAAVAAQGDLAAHPWPEDGAIRVRMGLHAGEGRLGGDDYIGIDVNRAARIASAGHGGQVLVSDAIRSLVQHDLPEGVKLRDLGQHRLKDIAHPEHLFDLVIEGLPSRFPPLRSLDARPNNLPLQLTSFVGRGAETAETGRLLEDHRLVTLTGAGGTGKTRLALEVAARVLPRFADGAFFIDLAPLGEPGLVGPAVGLALGLKEEQGRKVEDTVAEHLKDREILLVPDNFEHLLEATPVVEHLLGAAPRLRVLATSRTPLGLYGEQEQPVPPMALPDPRHLPELEALSRYEAVALFIQRAREANPAFAMTGQNASAVAEICARLDGLPLAIELAASRIKVLSPEAILSRLGSSLDVLTTTARNLPERQRTLRGAIEWSHDLLDEPERVLLARLSVFAGGADLGAVEAICNPGGDLGMDTLDGLASLVDKSLVRQTPAQKAEPRFGMLETIREYARARLDTRDDAEVTRRHHADHFLSLAEELANHQAGPDAPEWLARFDLDHDNLLEALGWAIETGEADRGMAAAAGIWRFWLMRGSIGVGRTWLERLLDVAGEPNRARALAHGAAGSLAYWQGDAAVTERHYEESLAMFRQLADRPGIAEAVYNLAFLPVVSGTGFDRSLQLLKEALGLFEELRDEEGIAKAKGSIGFFLLTAGDARSALPLLEESVALWRRRGDLFQLVDKLVDLSTAHRALGNLDDAWAAGLEALDAVNGSDVAGAIPSVLHIMAPVETARGRHDRAVRLFGAAEAISESLREDEPPSAISELRGDSVGEARKAIGDEATNRALAAGRAMSLDQAVAYARGAGE
jgi:predicted ATPase/class 3 adenylate cyclase